MAKGFQGPVDGYGDVWTGRPANVEQFRSAWAGKECWIMATGASLNRTSGLHWALSGKLVIGCNHVNRPNPRDDGFQGIVPRFLCMADIDGYAALKREVDSVPCTKVFAFLTPKDSHKWVCNTGQLHLPRDSVQVPLSLTKVGCAKLEVFDLNPAYRGVSVVTNIAMQFAFFLGCDPVYLIGVDCSDGGNYFDEEPSEGKPHFDANGPDYVVHRTVYEKHGRKLLNATVGGYLDCFERVDVRDVLDVEVRGG